jgi:hypothetical protein
MIFCSPRPVPLGVLHFGSSDFAGLYIDGPNGPQIHRQPIRVVRVATREEWWNDVTVDQSRPANQAVLSDPSYYFYEVDSD